MENNGDSGNREFLPGLYREDHSMKNNGYSTGTEDFPPAEDQSMGTNGYSTGNDEMFQLPPSTNFWANLWAQGILPQATDNFGAGQLETRQDIDSAVSDQGSIEGARRNVDLKSYVRFRKRENDKAYRQRSKATQERIQKERSDFAAQNEQLKRRIEALIDELHVKDELMKSTLETYGKEIKEKEQQVETLQLKLKILELEKKVMEAELGRVEAEKKLLQRDLAIANQSSQTQSKETDPGGHLQ